MKKVILLFALLCTMNAAVTAQEVFKEVRRLSSVIAADTTKDLTTRRVAQFKIDALGYMRQRYWEVMKDDSLMYYYDVLNHQSLALYEYIDLYMKRLTPLKKKKKREELQAVFQAASLENSKFFDTDKELVEAYIITPGFITTFSLDTDWEKALADVRRRLRSIDL